MRSLLACLLACLTTASSICLAGSSWTNASLEGVPARAPLSGATMPTKLGLLYLMGESESQGMIDLAATGRVPIVKSGEFASDRIMWCKRVNPETISVLAAGGPIHPATQTPEQAVEIIVARAHEQLGNAPKAYWPHIDFLEIMPCMWEPKSATEAAWFSAVITRAAPRVATELGVRPVTLNSGVGGLPVDPELLEPMIAGLRATMHVGGAWGYHGYTLDYTKNVEHERWHSLRYRQAYDYFEQHYPDLMQLPMILLEGGVDKLGNPDKDGWLERGTLEQYTDWLAWYDDELKKDPYVLGVTLFKIGAPSIWKSFELEPVVPWLHEHYKQTHEVE